MRVRKARVFGLICQKIVRLQSGVSAVNVMDSSTNAHQLRISDAENQSAPAKEFPLQEALEQPAVKLTVQTETRKERDARLERERAETLSRLRREEWEAQHNLEEEKAEAGSKLRNQLIVLCFVLILVLILFMMCVWIIFSDQYSEDIEKWATVTLTAILTGSVTTLLGFALGKASVK